MPPTPNVPLFSDSAQLLLRIVQLSVWNSHVLCSLLLSEFMNKMSFIFNSLILFGIDNFILLNFFGELWSSTWAGTVSLGVYFWIVFHLKLVKLNYMPLLVLCQAVHSFHLLMLDTANLFASLVYYFYLIVLGSYCYMSMSLCLKMQVLILVSGGWLCLEKPFNSQCV